MKIIINIISFLTKCSMTWKFPFSWYFWTVSFLCSAYLSVYWFVCLFLCLFVWLLVYLLVTVCLSACHSMFVCLLVTVCLSAYHSVCLCACLSPCFILSSVSLPFKNLFDMCQSVFLSIYLCLFVWHNIRSMHYRAYLTIQLSFFSFPNLHSSLLQMMSWNSL